MEWRCSLCRFCGGSSQQDTPNSDQPFWGNDFITWHHNKLGIYTLGWTYYLAWEDSGPIERARFVWLNWIRRLRRRLILWLFTASWLLALAYFLGLVAAFSSQRPKFGYFHFGIKTKLLHIQHCDVRFLYDRLVSKAYATASYNNHMWSTYVCQRWSRPKATKGKASDHFLHPSPCRIISSLTHVAALRRFRHRLTSRLRGCVLPRDWVLAANDTDYVAQRIEPHYCLPRAPITSRVPPSGGGHVAQPWIIASLAPRARVVPPNLPHAWAVFYGRSWWKTARQGDYHQLSRHGELQRPSRNVPTRHLPHGHMGHASQSKLGVPLHSCGSLRILCWAVKLVELIGWQIWVGAGLREVERIHPTPQEGSKKEALINPSHLQIH
jgi:hypothetical protein